MDYPTYDPASNNSPLTDDELEALDTLLQTLPSDGAMTLDGMDGYLTALLVSPQPLATLPTAAWLPAVWGGDLDPSTVTGATSVPAVCWPFPSNQKKKRTTVLVLRHLRSIAAQLAGAPQLWEPIFNVAEAPGSDGEELADATDWCLGFRAAVDLAPRAWTALEADPELGPGLATIALLAGDDAPQDEAQDDAGDASEAEDLDDPQVRDALSRAVADLVPALWARRPVA